MAIIVGRPAIWQDVIDAVTANYPEYLFLLPATQKEHPFFLDPLDDSVSQTTLLTMISPPNMSVRAMSVGSFSFFGEQISPQFVGDPTLSPLTAPDVFLDLQSAVYGDAAGPSVDLNLQEDAYMLAHPSFRRIGLLRTIYADFSVVPTGQYLARDKFCGKALS